MRLSGAQSSPTLAAADWPAVAALIGTATGGGGQVEGNTCQPLVCGGGCSNAILHGWRATRREVRGGARPTVSRSRRTFWFPRRAHSDANPVTPISAGPRTDTRVQRVSGWIHGPRALCQGEVRYTLK